MQQQKSKQVYNKIIQAGREILNKKDYHETIVEEIAQLAGVAKGTIFFYFQSKENLFREILLSLVDDVLSLIDKILQLNENPLVKLRKLYDEYIEFSIQNMHLFMTIRKEILSMDPKIEEVRQRLELVAKKLLPLIEEMFEKGLLKRIDHKMELMEIIPSMILIYISGVSSVIFFYRDKIDKIKEIYWNILLHGILNEDVSIEMLLFNEQSK